MTDPDVTIVVPTFTRADALVRCLDAITDTVAAPHEVVAVAVHRDHDTLDVLAGRPTIRTIVQPDRTGYVQAANLGFRAARGRFVTCLNDDCTLLPHALENAIRFMDAPAHRDRVGQAAFFHDTPVRRNVHQQIDVDDVRYRVLHVRGLCYANFGLIRRALGDRLDWYDERFTMYGADPDLSLRVWHDAELAVVPCPGSLVHHDELRDDTETSTRRQHDRDNQRLFEKWNLVVPVPIADG